MMMMMMMVSTCCPLTPPPALPCHLHVLFPQALLKRLRRARRVLKSSNADAILGGLQQHFVAGSYTCLRDALASVVQAHTHLRGALEGRLGRDGWGVLQRALHLLFEMSCTQVRCFFVLFFQWRRQQAAVGGAGTCAEPEARR